MNTAIRLSIAATFLLPQLLHAQPSDAQIIKDLTKPGVLKVELRSGTTKKEWSDAHDQYFWERAAVVWRNAEIPEYPNARIEIGGFARYHYVAGDFREFKVTYNTYTGIPAPNNDEVMGMLKGNLRGFLGEYKYNNIVGDLHYLRFPPDAGTTWHNPTSFSIPVEVSYDMITSYTEVTTFSERLEARFYRDAINAPWKDLIVTEEKERTTGAVKKYTEQEIKTMPTLGRVDAERNAQAQMSALPSVNIPAFASDMDVFLYTHKMLRESTAEQFEAYLMHMLAPAYFVEGSKTQFTQQGADLINTAVKEAFQGTSKYGEQYCADPAVKHHQENMVELWNATQDKKTRMTAGRFGGGWKNGQKVGEEYKITDLEVWMWTDADNIARIRSYEPGMLCKGTPAISTGAAPPQQQNGQAPANTGGNDAIQKGKGLLDKITKP